MISAIIDCGTNTFNLLVADYDDQDYKILLNTKIPVMLGEGSLKDNQIAPEAFQRGVRAFEELVGIARERGAEQIQAFATSAIRSGANGAEFVKEVLDKTGIIVQVINGDSEAQYIFKGVAFALTTVNAPLLIMDIGGGSTEFIIAAEGQVRWKKSFDLGATRLIQLFNPSDPVSPNQVDQLKSYLKLVLQPVKKKIKKHPVETLVGCSGAFESFAHIVYLQKGWSIKGKKVLKIDYEDFKELYKTLVASTREERLKMQGLPEYRVDTIVFAAIFVWRVMKKFGIKDLYFSSFALKEGALSDLIKYQRNPLGV